VGGGWSSPGGGGASPPPPRGFAAPPPPRHPRSVTRKMAIAPSPQPNLQWDAPAFSARFWGVIVATGVLSGLTGALLMRLLHWIESVAWPPYRTHPDFLDAVRLVSPGRRLLVLGLAALLAGIVRRLLSRRKTRAHGGDVVASIWLGSARIPLVRTLINSVLSVVVVGMGAALGREGAIKHAGSAFASKLSIWSSLPPSQRRLAVACGAGAGMAAAYNVPFGGALFAMEVLLGNLALPQVVPALAASLIGVACSWTLLPNVPVYPLELYHLTRADLIWSAVAAPILGVAGAYFVKAIAWADGLTWHGWRALVAPFVVLVGLGVLSLSVPEVLGNGKDVVLGTFNDKFPLSLLLVLPFLRMLASTACLAGGVPGGLFTPVMTCGASLSALMGRLAAPFLPGLDTRACAVIGATAFLAAATEGPVCSIVLMLELTRHIQSMMVPIMLAVAGATLVTRALESRSIYSARIRVKESGEVVPRKHGTTSSATGL